MADEMKVNGSTVRIIKGDSTDLEIQSFVYYAQHNLKVGSGFGTAISVRGGKGGKDRIVTLPDEVIVPLKRHLQGVKLVHERDLGDGAGNVYLPDALARKYPNAGRLWAWIGVISR